MKYINQMMCKASYFHLLESGFWILRKRFNFPPMQLDDIISISLSFRTTGKDSWSYKFWLRESGKTLMMLD